MLNLINIKHLLEEISFIKGFNRKCMYLRGGKLTIMMTSQNKDRQWTNHVRYVYNFILRFCKIIIKIIRNADSPDCGIFCNKVVESFGWIQKDCFARYFLFWTIRKEISQHLTKLHDWKTKMQKFVRLPVCVSFLNEDPCKLH